MTEYVDKPRAEMNASSRAPLAGRLWFRSLSVRPVLPPSLPSFPPQPRPPLLRPDGASVQLSSPPSSFPRGLKEAHYLTVLSQCDPHTHTHTRSLTTMSGRRWRVSCCAVTPGAPLRIRGTKLCRRAPQSSLTNATAAPLRMAAPSILRCTLAPCDVTGSALCHLSSVFLL